MTVRADNKKNEVIAKLEVDKSFKDRTAVRKKENEMLHKNTLKAH
jgi:hypothetical protein